MICQYCGERPATTHMKRTINGTTTEYHVCSECAAKHGIALFGNGGVDVGNLFGGLFTTPFLKEREDTKVCPTCATSFRQIVNSGSVGCPDCYTTFYDQLLPSIQRIHGKTSHVGKVAVGGDEEKRTARELEALKAELAKAVAEQQFEHCAELRDKIRALEGDQHD